MAKKDLRAQMDAGARQPFGYRRRPGRIWRRPRGGSPSGSSARSFEKDGAKAAPRRSRTHEVRSASLDETQAAAMPGIFSPRTIRQSLGARQSIGLPYGIASVLAASDAAGRPGRRCGGMVEAADTAGMVEVAGAAGRPEIASAAGTTETADAAAKLRWR